MRAEHSCSRRTNSRTNDAANERTHERNSSDRDKTSFVPRHGIPSVSQFRRTSSGVRGPGEGNPARPGRTFPLWLGWLAGQAGRTRSPEGHRRRTSFTLHVPVADAGDPPSLRSITFLSLPLLPALRPLPPRRFLVFFARFLSLLAAGTAPKA